MSETTDDPVHVFASRLRDENPIPLAREILNTLAQRDARIAELEAVADFHGSLLGDAAQKLREACDAHACLSQYDKVGAMHSLADEIDRALKTKEPTKPVKPDVVYDLKAMGFDPKKERVDSIEGVWFWWDRTPEGHNYWIDQELNPTAEGRDKIAAMREQFEKERRSDGF